MTQFSLFGPVSATMDGTTVDLGPPKQRSVLALLLLDANTVVSTDRLIEEIWGDRAPRTAQHSIQLYISSLRHALAADPDTRIETLPGGYRLIVDPGQVDIKAFEATVAEGLELQRIGRTEEAVSKLIHAIDLWSGPPLTEFAYQDFAQATIGRLMELHATAQEEVAAADLDRGRTLEALLRSSALVAEHPLRERPRSIQMLALHRLGRQPEALRAYREYVDLLGSELGLGPSSQIRRLEEQILLHDTAVRAEEPDQPTKRNPFKGLRAFREPDAPDFFGRDRLIETILERLRSNPRLVSVVGPSGTGKSSVVMAGLLPRLRSSFAGGATNPVIAVAVPGRDPFASVKAALGAGAGLDAGHTLEDLVDRAVRAHDRLFLVIDQFEELFIYPDGATTSSFLDALCGAAESAPGRVTIIVTLRSDHYGDPLLHPAFARLFVGSVIDVTPLAPAEIEEAVCGPAGSAGMVVEPGLIRLLVADMARTPGALPHLQYSLTEMASSESGLTVESYQRLGGMEGLIGRTADRVLDGLDAAGREIAQQALLRLVVVDRVGTSRRPVEVRELLDLTTDTRAVHSVISALINARLLTTGRDPADGSGLVEIAHEALLSNWGTLATWIRDHTDDIQLHARLRDAMQEWLANDEDPGFLLLGTKLERYSTWERQAHFRLTPDEQGFLWASRQEAERTSAFEAERTERIEKLGSRARLSLLGLAAAVVALAATATFAALSLRAPPPPRLAILTEELGGTFTEQIEAVATDIPGAVMIPVREKTIVTTLEELGEAGVGLVLSFPRWEAPTVEAAAKYPAVHFAILDRAAAPPPADLPNLTTVGVREEEGAFLAGAVAAAVSENGHIGFIGGVAFPTIFAFQAGFEAGARYVDPKIRIDKVYLGELPDVSAFNSFALAGIVATEMFEDGADVVFPAAGDSIYGVLEAARRHLLRTGEHRWVIGVDVDIRAEIDRMGAELDGMGVADRTLAEVTAWNEHVLTSMIKDLGAAILEVDRRLTTSTLETGSISLGLAEGAVGLTPAGIEDHLDLVDDISRRIISGEVIVSRVPEWDYELAFPRSPDEAEYWMEYWRLATNG